MGARYILVAVNVFKPSILVICVFWCVLDSSRELIKYKKWSDLLPYILLGRRAQIFL